MKIRSFLYSGLFIVALVILPGLAMAAPTAVTSDWTNSDQGGSYSRVTLAFSEDLTSAGSEACNEATGAPEGSICYPSSIVSFDQSSLLDIGGDQVYRDENPWTLIVKFVGANAFEPNISVVATVDGAGGIVNQTFESFTTTGYVTATQDTTPDADPLYWADYESQGYELIKIKALPNFNHKRNIGLCAGAPADSLCFETDSVTFHRMEDDVLVTLQNAVDRIYLDRSEPDYMYIVMGGTSSFVDGSGTEGVKVKWLTDPPGVDNNDNAGTLSDIYYSSFLFTDDQGAPKGGGSVPEMGVWAIIAILPVLGYLAYSSKPQGVRAV